MSDHEDKEVEQFYEQLDNIIVKTLKKDILVVHGDWNAKLGPDRYHHWAGTVGRFGDSPLPTTLHPHKLSMTAARHGLNWQVHN